MRLGIKSSDKFMDLLNEKNEIIQKLYMEKMKELTRTVNIKGMLGDSTITEQKTFEPKLIQEFFNDIIKKTPNWNSDNVAVTNNEDIRRIFVKIKSQEGNYLLTCHLSIQFHVLLFYKPDKKVMECQKELSEIIDKTKNSETKLAEYSDKYILEKLKEIGYHDLTHDELFKFFYENDDVLKKIYQEIDEKVENNIQTLLSRKKQLFNELDDLLMEIYQTSSVLIDDSKLVTGEEGFLCSIDLEIFKNKVKEGGIDPKKIPIKVKENLAKKLDELIQIMKI